MAHTATRRRPALVLGELRVPAELGVFKVVSPLFGALPPGPTRHVLVVPGFCADDSSTRHLRRLLGRLGHQAHGWELGRNYGPTAERIERLQHRLRSLSDEAGEPIAVIGWSLGGIYARVLALWEPDSVDQVITLGSPFNIEQGERTTVSPLYNLLERRNGFIKRAGDISLDPLGCPATSIYSRSDGVVSWATCLQTPGPRAENIEVRGSHTGLGVNIAAAYVIVDRLRRRADTWTPFEAPLGLRSLYPQRLPESLPI